MATGTLISLGLYFALMLGIGLYAYRQSTSNMSEYMLGGRKLGPAVTALSAGASDMSGWMLLGLPGAAYLSGLPVTWLAFGITIGALANYLIVAPRLRVYTEIAQDSLTIPDFFQKRFNDPSVALRVFASVVIVLFFTLYTSSGLVAGGKLFESAFGATYELGLWVTAGVVVTYTFAGGFMAVSLTDFVQGCIMFVALIMVPAVALMDIGGPADLANQLNAIDPKLLSFLSGATIIGVISSMSWGLGYFGQPHIIVRFMAIRSVKDVPIARNIGMSWMIVTVIGAVTTGLVGLAYTQKHNLAIDDPETIFIFLSQTLFNPYIAGFLLAAILAAVMSTISSQLLVASSSLTEDVYKLFLRRNAAQKELVLIGRLCVVGVALVAIFLAYDRTSSVLQLVSIAWAGFGAAFGPIVILSLYWRKLTAFGALCGMLAGAILVLVWTYVPLLPALEDGGAPQVLNSLIYSMAPGFILCWVIAMVVSLMGRPRDGVTDTFDRAKAAVKG